MASIQHGQLVESRKRSDIDFDAFSDVKRRKSEKGGKGTNYLFCLSMPGSLQIFILSFWLTSYQNTKMLCTVAVS